MSHFFAYLSRMKYIKRWSLMRSAIDENIQEHSHRVAAIAHVLGVIRNETFKGSINADRLTVLALYHDMGEVITGDMPSPIKYFNPEIKDAVKAIESVADEKLAGMLPPELIKAFDGIFKPREDEGEYWELIKAADKLCAYLKCLEERHSGNNPEFTKAEAMLEASLVTLDMPEVSYFIDTFVPSFKLTLDELN